jgi:hypothetical protein
MSAKIVLCVIRQILLNLIFCNDRQILAFFWCVPEKETKNLQVRIFIPDNQFN